MTLTLRAAARIQCPWCALDWPRYRADHQGAHLDPRPVQTVQGWSPVQVCEAWRLLDAAGDKPMTYEEALAIKAERQKAWDRENAA